MLLSKIERDTWYVTRTTSYFSSSGGYKLFQLVCGLQASDVPQCSNEAGFDAKQREVCNFCWQQIVQEASKHEKFVIKFDETVG